MSSRKSPRHAGLLAHKLAESALFRDLADRASQLRLKAEDVPLSEYLWQSTKSQQEDALKSKFIQGLQYGKLDPAHFGGYMVQDSVYCYYSKESIDTAAEKATDPNLKDFLEKRSQSYKTYYEELFTTWHIRDPTGIDLSKACADYAALEKKVAETMASLYLVVALIPCSKLWPWLGKQISDPPDALHDGINLTLHRVRLSDKLSHKVRRQKDIRLSALGFIAHLMAGQNLLLMERKHNFGVYESWVKSNLDPNYDGYKKLDKIIDDAFLVGAIDKEQALCVYKGCMTGEANFFSSV